MRIVSGIAMVLMFCACAGAQQAKSCGGLDYLIGEWSGVGSGHPGEGTGGFTFERQLQNKVIVRKNFAEYPASEGRPAYRHDDLMVIYEDAAKNRRADYWDNEAHVIRYVVNVSPDGCTITFESPKSATDAAYRLTYTIQSPDTLSIAFQIAPPGKDFGSYINASAKRKR